MTFILPSFGASAIAAVPAGGSFANDYSISLDGSNDYLLMGTAAISLDTNFTISAWFKPGTDALAGYDLIGGWGNASAGQARMMQILNSKLSFEIYLSRISGATTLSANTWYHGAVTFSGNNVEIFLNGSSDGTGTLSRSTITSSETFIGGSAAMSAVGWQPFLGLIDEFAVFDSVLSSSNITAIYNSGVPADLTSYSPVGWWRMGDNDSGTGTTITDQGSGGNDATLTNGPTYSSNVPFNYHSINLDGIDDYARLTGMTLSGAFTASFWFNPLSHAMGLGDLFMTKGYDSASLTSETDWKLDYASGGFRYSIFDRTQSWATKLEATHTFSFSANTWYHIMITYDGGTSTSGMGLFVDGVSKTLTTATQNPSFTGNNSTSATAVNVGNSSQWSGGVLTGLIDEVAFWETDQSANISSIYTGTAPIDLSGLSTAPNDWFRFENNANNEISGGSGSASLVNSPTYSTSVPS